MKIPRLNQIKDLAIIVAIIYIIFSHANGPKEIIKESVIIITDTITTPRVIVQPTPIYITKPVMIHDTVTIIKKDTSIIVMNDTILVPIDRNLFADTIKFEGGAILKAMHIVDGVIDKSLYDLTYYSDTVKIRRDIYHKPTRFSLEATSGIGMFKPGVHVSNDKWSAGYGYDLVNRQHQFTVGVKLFEI